MWLVGWGAAVVAYGAPIVAGLRAFLGPLGQKAQAGDFRRVAFLDAIPEDGSPLSVPVLADRVDAWNRVPNQPIGGVLLRRLGPDKVLAINVFCPHQGCAVEYQAESKRLFCPCHSASFDLEGKRLEPNSMSPRDLDILEAEVRNGNEVWVQFMNFRTGTPEKIPE